MYQYLNFFMVFFTIPHPRMVIWCSSTMLTLYFLAILKNKRQYFEPKNSKEGAKRKRNDLVPFVPSPAAKNSFLEIQWSERIKHQTGTSWRNWIWGLIQELGTSF